MNIARNIVGYLLFSGLAISLMAQTDNSLREGDKTDPAINPIYNYYEWKNEIPENCPFERSKDIKGVIFSGRYANYTGADTWYLQSAPDGNMYSAWTDGKIDGFSTNSNIRSQSTGQAKITGTDPVQHRRTLSHYSPG